METTNSETMGTQTMSTDSKMQNRNRLILLAVLLFLIFAIFIGAFVVASRGTQPAVVIENTSVVPEPTPTPVVSTPVATSPSPTPTPVSTTSTFNGRVFEVGFDYDKVLGTATSSTLRMAFGNSPNFDTDCKSETINFSDDSTIQISIYSGHCEGAFGGTGDTQTLTSRDGKTFTMTSILQNDGNYTIRGLQSMDGIDTQGSALQGMQIEVTGIAPADLQKYQDIVKGIITSTSIELSPLKSTDFDKVQ